MRKFLTEQSEINEMLKYLIDEFDTVDKCCQIYWPSFGTVVVILDPIQSCYYLRPDWGTSNLVDGNIPASTYRIVPSKQRGHSQHFIDLEPIHGGKTITACSGYRGTSSIDWRGVRKAPIEMQKRKRTG